MCYVRTSKLIRKAAGSQNAAVTKANNAPVAPSTTINTNINVVVSPANNKELRLKKDSARPSIPPSGLNIQPINDFNAPFLDQTYLLNDLLNGTEISKDFNLFDFLPASEIDTDALLGDVSIISPLSESFQDFSSIGSAPSTPNNIATTTASPPLVNGDGAQPIVLNMNTSYAFDGTGFPTPQSSPINIVYNGPIDTGSDPLFPDLSSLTSTSPKITVSANGASSSYPIAQSNTTNSNGVSYSLAAANHKPSPITATTTSTSSGMKDNNTSRSKKGGSSPSIASSSVKNESISSGSASGGSAVAAPSRKRALSPEFDDDCSDTMVVAKRQKNTEAARRSRARKVARMESLEGQVRELETNGSNLLLKIAVLENEKSSWIEREIELRRRIASLEGQLTQAHHSMMQFSALPQVL